MFTATNIEKSFGKNKILKGVSLKAAPGEWLCITGPNGCGKTTLLRILAGALLADGGDISLSIKGGGSSASEAGNNNLSIKGGGSNTSAAGNNSLSIKGGGSNASPSGNKNFFKNNVGYVPQEDPLLGELTVVDNLRLWGAKKKDIDRLCSLFNMESYCKKNVASLSGGMRRRVSLALGFLKAYPVLIMDEPTSALDIDAKQGAADLFKSYTANGGIIIMASHDKGEIELSSRVLRMEEGAFV